LFRRVCILVSGGDNRTVGNLVSFSGEVFSSDDARIRAESGAALYGNGIFTTIAIFNGEPFLWEKHWRRLVDNCDKVGLEIGGFTERQVQDYLSEIINRNAVRDGRARITIFDEAASAFWSHASELRTSIFILTAERRPTSHPLRLTISPHRTSSTSPLAGIKSCNYLDKHLARSEARDRGFNEAVQLNERGEIVSACMANLFWTKNEKLFTPSLETGCLAGTTREFVIENLKCAEVEAGGAELNDADDIFLTSAGVGIIRVDELDGRSLKLDPHPITGLLPAI
jgi:branched-subunit amino acid aminotransferase/4-amino-4-deoxychorismate lyase